jgi:hypothetical protein
MINLINPAFSEEFSRFTDKIVTFEYPGNWKQFPSQVVSGMKQQMNN